MNKHEVKFTNTAKRIQQALLDLLDTKNFSEISIAELCKTANVNRSTFYAHYENTYDLLSETQESIIKTFYDRFNTDENAILMSDKANYYLLVPQYLVPFLEYVKVNKTIFKVYMNNLGNFNANSTYTQQLNKIFIPICNSFGVTDNKAINYMCKFFLDGILAIVKDWLNNNCNDDIMYLCNIIELCVNPKGKNVL